MIDLSEYNLEYTHRETEKVYRARSVQSGVAILVHPDTGEKTKHWTTSEKFKKEFKGSKKNRKASSKPKHALPSTGNSLLYSRKFQNYLNESKERMLNG